MNKKTLLIKVMKVCDAISLRSMKLGYWCGKEVVNIIHNECNKPNEFGIHLYACNINGQKRIAIFKNFCSVCVECECILEKEFIRVELIQRLGQFRIYVPLEKWICPYCGRRIAMLPVEDRREPIDVTAEFEKVLEKNIEWKSEKTE